MELLVENSKKLRKLKSKIEKVLDIQLNITRSKISFESEDAYKEFIAKIIIEAMDFGFELEEASQLKKEDYMMGIINLKEYARPTRLRETLGRMIGKKGKAIRTLSQLSDCSIKIKDYTVALIGSTDDVDTALLALKKLARGSPHAKVYGFLERKKAEKKMIERDDIRIIRNELKEE